MRRTWRWDPERREMVEVTAQRAAPQTGVNAPMVHGDFKPMNVGGVVIEDRGHLRRYLKARDLAPYDPNAARAARERLAREQAAERKRAVIDSFEHVRNQNRARSRFG